MAEDQMIADSIDTLGLDFEDSIDASTEGTVEPAVAPETGTPAEGDDKEEKRIADTAAALKEKQRELHATNEAIAKAKADMDGFLEGIKAQKEAFVAQDKAPDKDWLDDESLNELAESDPIEYSKQIARQQRAEFARILEARDAHIANLLEQRIATETSPEKALLKPVIDKLSKQGWFKSLSPEAKLEAAREYQAVAPKPKPSPQPSLASPNGTGRTASFAPRDDAYEKQLEAQSKAIFGDDDRGNDDVVGLEIA